MPASLIARHRTAIERNAYSRPVSLALKDGLIHLNTTVFDYGCGRGGDISRLRSEGISCQGWDPALQPDGLRTESDVVNLGYVVNVIEDATEREAALRDAWGLAKSLLIVSARLEAEARPGGAVVLSDGYVTRLGTFQKLYQQDELGRWIEATLGITGVPAGPGVFYVFRDEAQRQGYLAARHRRLGGTPRIRRCDTLYEQHKEILQPLLQFLCARGRLPQPNELPGAQPILEAFGSLPRAFTVLRSVVEETLWDETREKQTQDLLIYIALSRFTNRPRFSDLPIDLQADIRAFFTSYQAACELADAMLYSTGDMSLVDQLCRKSKVGKQTPAALYVHESALNELDPVLRLYEGCARTYIGSVEGANLVKLHRKTAQVSYLSYPDFEDEPHPALRVSLVVPLRTFQINVRYYETNKNPPILHRKEQFISEKHPLREKFARLTAQEERFGLYATPATIGTLDGWTAALRKKQLVLRGHRVVRNRLAL